jgi:hypothetical protein
MFSLQEELFTGCNKKFNINRRIRDGASGTYMQVTKTIECPIKPGYKAGTKLTFPDDGDEQPDGDDPPPQPWCCTCLHVMAVADGGLRAIIESDNVISKPKPFTKYHFAYDAFNIGTFQDIQFVIQEKPHSMFSRQGNDLVHKRFESFIRGVWLPVDVALLGMFP